MAAWVHITSVPLRELVRRVSVFVRGICLPHRLPDRSLASPFARLMLLTASPLRSNEPLRCRILSPAFHRLRLLCPRLRSRLTLGRLPLPRNPQASGGSGSHRPCVTHSGILTWTRSTTPPGVASLPAQRSPTIVWPAARQSTASVSCLSLRALSVHAHSTSELLRTLAMMAASEPTSWLSSRTHSLSHSAGIWRP